MMDYHDKLCGNCVCGCFSVVVVFFVFFCSLHSVAVENVNMEDINAAVLYLKR